MRFEVATTDRLRREGFGRADIEAALRAGTLRRIRRGWYATAEADPALVTAVRVGGWLSCVTALRRSGVWTIDDGTIHVRVVAGHAVRPARGVVLHWTHGAMGCDPVQDPPAAALACALGCLDIRHAVAVVDSVANAGVLGAELETVLTRTARGRTILGLHDSRAESGLETYMRLALRAARIRSRPQVVIRGVGRVDLLVGDRLVVELDGRRWHGDFARDRARDRALLARGYLVMRASYEQVMHEMDRLVDDVATVVRRREHQWQLTQRRDAELAQKPGFIDR